MSEDVSAPSDHERSWFYVDAQMNTQRGPVPAVVLRRLVQKGVGVAPSSLVWKHGMTEWTPIAEVEEFADTVRFETTQWFYLDAEGAQRGPVLSRFLLQQLREGAIDGMTLVFGGDLAAWLPLSDVPRLKTEMQRVLQEEEALQRLPTSEAAEQVFNPDVVFEGVQQTNPEDFQFAPEEVGREDASKYVLSADGLRYKWDDEEHTWAVDEDERERRECEEEPLMDDEDADGGDSRWRKRKRPLPAGDPDSEVDDEDEQQQQRKREAENNEEDEEEDEDDEEEGKEDKQDNNGKTQTGGAPKKKRSKRKKKKSTLWVYISGLPVDVTFEEVKEHFSKVGLIAISPVDQQPRIKIYREPGTDHCKGDASICYNAEQSVQLALDILDGGYIRPNFRISVTRASFDKPPDAPTAKAAEGNGKASSVSSAQIKVARNAARQALAWNDEEDIGIAKPTALRIIVLEGMFKPEEFANPAFEVELEQDVAQECTKFGVIEKMTIFSKNPRGIVVIKFATAFAAQECIKVMNGRFFGTVKIKCYFWDGVTNYSMVPLAAEQEDAEEKEEEERLEKFADWLEEEQEELPDEFKLNTEN